MFRQKFFKKKKRSNSSITPIAFPPVPTTHVKARGPFPSYPVRFSVPIEKVSWSVQWDEYKPVEYTAQVVINFNRLIKPNGWADPPDFDLEVIKKRFSHHGPVKIVDGRPINPVGRTGISGRGLLGNWGPNHAADPIVTREHPETGVLEMIVVQRADTKEWAIPGGMVDPGEAVSATLKREFGEEALNTLEMSPEELEHVKVLLSELFDPKNGTEVYKGYVDDGRNTDHSWMETKAVNFHCSPELAKRIQLKAGDDATAVSWLEIKRGSETIEKLFASHKEFVLKTLDMYEQKNLSKKTVQKKK
eukprot:c14662_g3_i1.p1 GENE.c14662_g3_i1~~c14662_g3_i1.p1  ORF type:complete len:304 (+),score=132.98 c14662_g3_i1:80-991(+)